MGPSASSTPGSSSTSVATTQCLVRQHSYTHSFPSRPSSGSAASTSITSSGERQGLSPETRALAKQAFEISQQDPYNRDRTMLFFGGLQWLLDSTIESSNRESINEAGESRKPSLTEDAVRAFDILDKNSGRIVELRNSEDGERPEAVRTNAWLSEQMSSE